MVAYFYDSSKRVGVFLCKHGLTEDYYEFFLVFKLEIAEIFESNNDGIIICKICVKI